MTVLKDELGAAGCALWSRKQEPVFPMRTSLDLAACRAARACSWVQMAAQDRISHSLCPSSLSPSVLVRPLFPLVLLFWQHDMD